MPLTIGQVLQERYRIDVLLGRGGMGTVYRGTDMRFDTPVAIKENQIVTPESQKQFAREAGLLHRLRHPNLPRVTDHFSIPGQGQYLVMDYVEGEGLNQIMARPGTLTEAQALDWIGQVLDALEFLHSRGIIHRDVKPANVKITPNGQVYLVDFGLAKVYDPEQRTTLGARGVTPGYAPPEQYGMGRTDARADIYSAGATLYALLTGRAPADALERLTGQARLVPPRQLSPYLSLAVEAAVLQAMQPRPSDRFQTATEFRRALLKSPVLRGPTVQPEPWPITPSPMPEPAVAEGPLTPVPPTATAQPAPPSAPPRTDASAQRRRRPLPTWFWLMAGAAVCLVIVIGVATAALMSPGDSGGEMVALESPPSAATSTQPPAPSEPTPQEALPHVEEPEPYPPPILKHPGREGTPELHGEVTFAWGFPSPLRPGEAFQLLIWHTEDREHQPAAEYWPDLELTINLDDLPQVRQWGPGEYWWSVAVVDTRTRQQISPEAEAGSFLYVGPQGPPGEPGSLPAPILGEPPPGAELGTAAVFFWEWPHEPLGEEFFFDLRIWALPEAELPPGARRAATRPTKGNEIGIELPSVPAIIDHGPGDYFWTVVVVVKPCPDCPPEVISEWGEERLFHYVGP